MYFRVNRRITAEIVRVISEDGANMGIHSLKSALDLVRYSGKDLVEVEPEANPPVCQLIDFGKFRYRLQQSRKN